MKALEKPDDVFDFPPDSGHDQGSVLGPEHHGGVAETGLQQLGLVALDHRRRQYVHYVCAKPFVVVR